MGVSQWLIQNFRSEGGGGGGGGLIHSEKRGGAPEWKRKFSQPPKWYPLIYRGYY